MPGSEKLKNIERRLRLLAGKAFIKLRIHNAHADVFLLEGQKMAKIKRKYTGKKPKNPVDVLAFPESAGFPHQETKKRFLGEVYINAELAVRDPGRARHL